MPVVIFTSLCFCLSHFNVMVAIQSNWLLKVLLMGCMNKVETSLKYCQVQMMMNAQSLCAVLFNSSMI